MGKNDMIKMKLTPQEVAIIENIRALNNLQIMSDTSKTWKSEDFQREELKEKYWAMDEAEFMREYREAIGDEFIIDAVTQSLTIQEMMEVIAEWVDGEEVEELWNRFVPEERVNELFFSSNDHEDLVNHLVDRVMDGAWSPEN